MAMMTLVTQLNEAHLNSKAVQALCELRNAMDRIDAEVEKEPLCKGDIMKELGFDIASECWPYVYA